MKKKRTTKSQSARSLRELPAKAVRRETSEGIKGGFGASEHTGIGGLYLNFDGIKGNVTEETHASWIELN